METMDHGGFNRRDSHPLSSCRRWFHTLRSFWNQAFFLHCCCWNKRRVGVWDALSQVRFPNPLAVGEPDHPITCWHGLYHFYPFHLTMAWQYTCSTRLVGYCTQLQHQRMTLSLFGIRKIRYLIDMLVWVNWERMTLHEVDMFGVIEHEQSFWKRKRCISSLVCKNFKLYCLSQHWEWPAVVGLQGALWSRQWTGVNISSQEMDDISNSTILPIRFN